MFFRRRLSPAGRRAALFVAGCGVGAVLLIMVVSAWKPVLDGRYASVVWGPLFALVGAGFALVRIRVLLAVCLCAIGAASVGLASADDHPDTPSAVALLEARVGPHDLVDATPSQYLLLDYYESAALRSRTRVVAADVAWYWGTAAFAPGTVVASVPAAVVREGGTIYLVHRPSEAAEAMPAGYVAAVDALLGGRLRHRVPALTRLSWPARWRAAGGGRRALVAADHGADQVDAELRVVEDELLELAVGQHQAVQRGLGAHRGGAQAVAEDGDLAEEVAGAEGGDAPAIDQHGCLAGDHQEEVAAAQALQDDAAAAREVDLVELGEDVRQLAGAMPSKSGAPASAGCVAGVAEVVGTQSEVSATMRSVRLVRSVGLSSSSGTSLSLSAILVG